jgi:hypothetical protein
MMGPPASGSIDESIRAAMLGRPNGPSPTPNRIHRCLHRCVEPARDVVPGQSWDYTESVANLLDPDDPPLRYAQVMTTATACAAAPKSDPDARLGGGSISTYLRRFMPIRITTESTWVITAARLFRLREMMLSYRAAMAVFQPQC